MSGDANQKLGALAPLLTRRVQEEAIQLLGRKRSTPSAEEALPRVHKGEQDSEASGLRGFIKRHEREVGVAMVGVGGLGLLSGCATTAMAQVRAPAPTTPKITANPDF
jgi:hypothetical protein